MTLTATDLFCGAGGSSLGAETAGVRLAMGANHWPKAIEVHQENFPDAGAVGRAWATYNPGPTVSDGYAASKEAS